MNVLFLDIETYADHPEVERALASGPPSLKPPKNYKDAEKIKAYLERAMAEWKRAIIDKSALSAFTGQVGVVGLCLEEEENPWCLSQSHHTEVGLLTSLSTVLWETGRLVTFNGFAFDIPFLRTRFIRHGLTVPTCLLPASKYNTGAHVDLRLLLTNYDSHHSGTLDHWTRFLTREEIDPTTDPDTGLTLEGCDLPKLQEDGKWGLVEDKCRRDINLLRHLYRHMYKCGMIPSQ